MCSTDYLTPFVEVGRALCDGADTYSVMNLIARRITETLQLKGCLIKMLSPNVDRLELMSSYGLSENFLFSEPQSSPDSLCFRLPENVRCLSNLQDSELIAEREAMLIEGIRAVAAVPIEVNQKALALVVLCAPSPREFTRAELSFAEALAGRGILSFNARRRMDETIQQEREFLKSFQDISSTINATLNINKVLEMVVQKVSQLLGGKGCTVRLLDSKTQKLYLAQSFGLSKEFLNKGPVDAQKSIAENMAGKIVVIDDVITDPRLQYQAEAIEEGIRKVLSIPLIVRSKVIGVLRLFTADRPPFTNREIQFANAVAQQCAFAIENARIYQRLKYEYQQLLIDFDYNGSSH
ncbi:MAG: GAF domain-containing protein [Desulfoferrobacter sp.]